MKEHMIRYTYGYKLNTQSVYFGANKQFQKPSIQPTAIRKMSPAKRKSGNDVRKLKKDLKEAIAAKKKMEETLRKVGELLKDKNGEAPAQDKIPDKIQRLLFTSKLKDAKMEALKKRMELMQTSSRL